MSTLDSHEAVGINHGRGWQPSIENNLFSTPINYLLSPIIYTSDVYNELSSSASTSMDDWLIGQGFYVQ